MSAPAVHVVPIFATPFGVVTLPEVRVEEYPALSKALTRNWYDPAA